MGAKKDDVLSSLYHGSRSRFNTTVADELEFQTRAFSRVEALANGKMELSDIIIKHNNITDPNIIEELKTYEVEKSNSVAQRIVALKNKTPEISKRELKFLNEPNVSMDERVNVIVGYLKEAAIGNRKNSTVRQLKLNTKMQLALKIAFLKYKNECFSSQHGKILSNEVQRIIGKLPENKAKKSILHKKYKHR
ncbi:MAG: hypothetical protein LBM38_01180 [Clostridiales bacterium]|jgi:hypothetical protein|nr:hypothetical protein [Clostridiales bacterium]